MSQVSLMLLQSSFTCGNQVLTPHLQPEAEKNQYQYNSAIEFLKINLAMFLFKNK